MKRASRAIPCFTVVCLLHLSGRAQDKTELSLNLGYFNDNDRIQYLIANAKTKVNGKFQPRDSVRVNFFITDESPTHLLGKAVTNSRGDAVLYMPASAREEWNSASKQSLIAVAEAAAGYDAATSSLDLEKATIRLDTAADKTIVATVLRQQGKEWMPVKGVDLILAVRRLGGNLNVSRTPTYTTDSAGKVSADFKLENLPGDDSGNLALIARIDANDLYGTISKEKKVQWGVARGHASNFDKRTLYARRGLAPLSLGFIAYSIALAVWAVIVYLLVQLRKIKKIGTAGNSV